MFFVLLAAACSTEKDKFVNREYHKLTTHYNGYFNGNESFKEGVEKLENTVIDDYEQILPAYILGTSDDAKSIYPQMDRALDKAAKVVRRHSMVIKGEEKNEWIDDNYLLIGKARFYKQEYIASLEAFNYVSLQFNEGPFDEQHAPGIDSQVLSKEIKSEISAADYEAAAVAAAMSMEESAIKLYSGRAAATTDPNEKALYNWLAEWERQHLDFLADIDRELREDIWYDQSFWPFW